MRNYAFIYAVCLSMPMLLLPLHFQSAINWLASKGISSDYIEAMTVSKQLQVEQWDAHCSCKWSFIANSFATIINICEELEAAAAAAVSAILDMNHVKIIVRRASRWRIFYWLDVLATTTSLRRLVLFYEFSFPFPFPIVCIKNCLVFHLSRALSLSVQIENIHSTPTKHTANVSGYGCVAKVSLFLAIVGANCETFFLFPSNESTFH